MDFLWARQNEDNLQIKAIFFLNNLHAETLANYWQPSADEIVTQSTQV